MFERNHLPVCEVALTDSVKNELDLTVFTQPLLITICPSSGFNSLGLGQASVRFLQGFAAFGRNSPQTDLYRVGRHGSILRQGGQSRAR